MSLSFANQRPTPSITIEPYTIKYSHVSHSILPSSLEIWGLYQYLEVSLTNLALSWFWVSVAEECPSEDSLINCTCLKMKNTKFAAFTHCDEWCHCPSNEKTQIREYMYHQNQKEKEGNQISNLLNPEAKLANTNWEKWAVFQFPFHVKYSTLTLTGLDCQRL